MILGVHGDGLQAIAGVLERALELIFSRYGGVGLVALAGFLLAWRWIGVRRRL